MTAPPEPLRRFALACGRRLLGRRFAEAMAELREAERLPPDRLRARQNARLARIARHAAERVPFWRRVFGERGLAADAIRTVEDLSRLPVVDRDTLRGEPLEHWIADGVPPWRHLPYTTSGSTGDPLRFVLDRAATPIVFASHLYFDSWHGIAPFDRCLRVMGPPAPEPAISGGAPLGVRARARLASVLQRGYERLTQERLTTFEADPETIWRILATRRPDYVMGYTSTLATIATELARAGRSCPAPIRCVVTIAEPLTPERRAALESWFGCAIANRYGQRELKYWCAQSEPGDPCRFVVVPDLVVAEVLREDDTPAPPGEVGRLVLTGLHNEVMPFLRYDTRDLAALEPAPPDARRPFPVLSRLCGRSVEVLATPDGRYVDPTSLGHHLFVVHDHVDAVRAYQLVLEAGDLATLRVVPAIPPGAWIERLHDDLQELLGPRMHCRVQPVAEIPLESSGKRPIIRLSPRSDGVVAPA